LIAHHAEVSERPRDPRIPARVRGNASAQIVDRDLRRQSSGAPYFEPVIVEPDLHGLSLDAVVAVRDCIHERLLPGKRGVLGHLLEEQIVETG